MTGAAGGRALIDSVRSYNRAHHESMAREWTQEQRAKRVLCDGHENIKRSRIDYLLASGAALAEAHTDDPGWAGAQPGTRAAGVTKYSDHRFVWGRFVLSGPPRAGASSCRGRPAGTRRDGLCTAPLPAAT